jgi:hypothetical protein
MHHDGRERASISPKQDEAPAGVGRYGNDRAHADFFVRERILAPFEAFVRREQHMVCRFLVVRHHEDRARISKLPQVRVLMYLFPREARIAAQERVALLVRREFLADVADRHHQPDDRWAAVSCTGV